MRDADKLNPHISEITQRNKKAKAYALAFEILN